MREGEFFFGNWCFRQFHLICCRIPSGGDCAILFPGRRASGTGAARSDTCLLADWSFSFQPLVREFISETCSVEIHWARVSLWFRWHHQTGRPRYAAVVPKETRSVSERTCLLSWEAYAMLGVTPQISDTDLTKAYEARIYSLGESFDWISFRRKKKARLVLASSFWSWLRSEWAA